MDQMPPSRHLYWGTIARRFLAARGNKLVSGPFNGFMCGERQERGDAPTAEHVCLDRLEANTLVLPQWVVCLEGAFNEHFGHFPCREIESKLAIYS